MEGNCIFFKCFSMLFIFTHHSTYPVFFSFVFFGAIFHIFIIKLKFMQISLKLIWGWCVEVSKSCVWCLRLTLFALIQCIPLWNLSHISSLYNHHSLRIPRLWYTYSSEYCRWYRSLCSRKYVVPYPLMCYL